MQHLDVNSPSNKHVSGASLVGAVRISTVASFRRAMRPYGVFEHAPELRK